MLARENIRHTESELAILYQNAQRKVIQLLFGSLLPSPVTLPPLLSVSSTLSPTLSLSCSLTLVFIPHLPPTPEYWFQF